MCHTHLNRRDFLGLGAAIAAGSSGLSDSTRSSAEEEQTEPGLWDPPRPLLVPGQPLTVQPVLMYKISRRRKATSWRSWGPVQSDQAAAEEAERITKELRTHVAATDVPIKLNPLVKVVSEQEAQEISKGDHDVLLIYAASGRLLEACLAGKKNTVIFVRHRSGPLYQWYEALSVKYLSTGTERPDSGNAPTLPHVSVNDVVVDDYREMLWRLRALYGVKNFLGSRIVAFGGAGGKYSPEAPDVARKRYRLDIIEISYDAFAPRIQKAMADDKRLALAREWTDRYMSLPHTTLMTDKKFVRNAFVLYMLFKELMREHNARAFTIRECMTRILPLSQTTACLTLSLLNDEGLLAFCESDFVIIPAGILLRHVGGKPVFLHNSTFPHNGVVTCAHCTAPRRMDGTRYEPVKIMTHYESDFGAAPKVEMPEGQTVTFVDPEYSTGRWIGFTGTIQSNPFYEICRSQQDVEIHGDWRMLIREARDSHWMMAYGNCLKEVGYAAEKIGIVWETLSRT